jgi:hypothetical protein
VGADGEHQDRTEADVGAGHRAADQEGERPGARMFRSLDTGIGKLVNRRVKHRKPFRYGKRPLV